MRRDIWIVAHGMSGSDTATWEWPRWVEAKLIEEEKAMTGAEYRKAISKLGMTTADLSPSELTTAHRIDERKQRMIVEAFRCCSIVIKNT